MSRMTVSRRILSATRGALLLSLLLLPSRTSAQQFPYEPVRDTEEIRYRVSNSRLWLSPKTVVGTASGVNVGSDQQKLTSELNSLLRTRSDRPKWLIPIAGAVIGGGVAYTVANGNDDLCTGPGDDYGCLAVPGYTLFGAFFGGLVGLIVEANLP